MLLSTADAARRLGISIRRVQRLIQLGLLPAQQVGGRFVIDDADLARAAERPTRRGWRLGRKRTAPRAGDAPQ
jgi:excisionase family DNA binding protein